MSPEPKLNLDQATRSAIDEIKATITERYPGASFAVSRGDDPEGIYLRTTIDLDDVDQVLDGILDELYDIQVERALPIYVIPLQPVDRVLESLSNSALPARPRIDWQAARSPVQP